MTNNFVALDNDNIAPSFDGIEIIDHVNQKIEWIKSIYNNDKRSKLWVKIRDAGVFLIENLAIKKTDNHLYVLNDKKNIDISHACIYGTVNGVSVDFVDTDLYANIESEI